MVTPNSLSLVSSNSFAIDLHRLSLHHAKSDEGHKANEEGEAACTSPSHESHEDQEATTGLYTLVCFCFWACRVARDPSRPKQTINLFIVVWRMAGRAVI